jgi:hypothetical protein
MKGAARVNCRVGLAALVLIAVGSACTETPSDIPECVLPGSGCPSLDGGVDAVADATTDGSPDAPPHDASGDALGD